MSLVIYFVFAYALLAALTGMILQISRKMGECPDTGRAARAAGVTIATGYAAIGAGGAMLVGSALPVVQGGTPATLFAIGFTAIILGLGFSNAIMTLRSAVLTAQPKLQAAGLVDAAQIAAPVAAV